MIGRLIQTSSSIPLSTFGSANWNSLFPISSIVDSKAKLEVIEYFLRTLQKYYPEKLESRYGIKEVDEDIINTLDIIGKKRGCLIKGGEIDYDKVIQVIMSDIKDGLIKNITFDRFEEWVYG